MSDQHPFDALRDLCAKLRSPGGCPWDRQQTLETLKTYVLEEAYELLEALDREDPELLAAELGDLLFQVVFVARLAEERGWFDLTDVCRRIEAKMIRRHPHVFGAAEAATAGEVVQRWERIKKRESGGRSALAGVPDQLPALLKALRITEKAAALGFDWRSAVDVADKVAEEARELASARAAAPMEHVKEELGDMLFALANLSRYLGIDPEDALQAANRKFATRFAQMERVAAESGVPLAGRTLEELNNLWEQTKEGERTGVQE